MYSVHVIIRKKSLIEQGSYMSCHLISTFMKQVKGLLFSESLAALQVTSKIIL